jgi:hypothetical protein
MAENFEVDPPKEVPFSAAGDESTLATDKEDKTESESEKQNRSKPSIEKAGEAAEVSTADEFPHGVSLAFIVLAIMLDTFLISLDQVRYLHFTSNSLWIHILTLLDNCRYRNPENH